MRFFFDENISPQVVVPLRPIYFDHHFDSIHDPHWERLRGTDDRELLATLRHRFDAFVTSDRSQLKDHRAALVQSGLHWVGVKDPAIGGVRGIAAMSAALMATIPHIIDHTDALADGEASWIQVKRIPAQTGQRLAILDLQTGRERKSA